MAHLGVSNDAPRPKLATNENALLWTLQGLAALAFLFAGISKLIGLRDMVQLFAAVGVGQWFRYVTGAIEVTGAVLLVLSPTLALIGAAALAVTMACAVATQLFVIGGNPALPAVLLLMSSTVAWIRWRHLCDDPPSDPYFTPCKGAPQPS